MFTSNLAKFKCVSYLKVSGFLVSDYLHQLHPYWFPNNAGNGSTLYTPAAADNLIQ